MTISGPLKDAMALAQRFQHSDAIRHYVVQRLWLVAPAALLMVLTSLALAFGIVTTVGGTRASTVFLALLLSPFVLVGSAAVQAYVFLAWLEERAIARALGKPAPLAVPPRMPWLFVGLLVVLPFLALFAAAPHVALAVLAAQVAVVLAYASLDR